PNNKVLIVGPTLPGAQLYTIGTTGPTNPWSFAPGLAVPRRQHTATLLSGGTRVMIAGGMDRNPSSLNSVEIYDSVTGTWRSGPPMSFTHFRHTANRLPDGRVVVIGGSGVDSRTKVEAYIEDGNAGSWVTLPEFPDPTRTDSHISATLGSSIM